MTPINTDTRVELVQGELTHSIIGGFYEVYNTLGYGYLENVYANALEIELKDRGHEVRREVPVCVVYKGRKVGLYRADMIVQSKVLIEVKASEMLSRADHKQVMNYQQASRVPVALIFHFGPEPSFHRTILNDSRARAKTDSG